MSEQIEPTAIFSQKKLKGVYWKSFVRFVNKDDQVLRRNFRYDEARSLQQRQGSFEYMELAVRDGSSLPSDSSDSCCSSAYNSSTESLKDEKIPMYAILDMSTGKEFALNEDISIIEEASETSDSHSTISSSRHLPAPQSPKFSPILDDRSHPRIILTPSPLQQDSEGEESRNEGGLRADGEDEQSSFDLLESKSPSMEPAPWRDQILSIQLWMVPPVSPSNNDRILIPPPITESEHCHYVPTLEVILEESEESSEGRSLTRSRISKSASFSDDTELHAYVDRPNITRSSSAGDLANLMKQSQDNDDLYSITSTFGSLNSMRRMATFENLSADEIDQQRSGDFDSGGSSDELDRVEDLNNCSSTADSCVEMIENRNFQSENTEKECSQKFDKLSPEITSLSLVKQDSHSVNKANSVNEKFDDFQISEKTDLTLTEIKGEKANTEPSSTENRRSRSSTDSAAHSVDNSDFLSSGRSSPMIESAPEYYESRLDTRSNTPESVRRDSGVTISDLDIPGFPKELYFDSRDIPKIVVMFAQEEIEKDRVARQSAAEETTDGIAVEYRKQSLPNDSENPHDSAYSSREGVVQRRISQLRSAESSRLSTLSSSTPELTTTNSDCLLYIPVSYASEAAAKKKKKRRATMSTAEASKRRANFGKAVQTKALINGTGLGNGFSSLRKRLKSRKSESTSATLRRSQSDKTQLSYSSPDVSSAMSKFLNSPRRLARLRMKEPTNDDGKRKGIKKTMSNIFRRLSSKFSSQNRPAVPQNSDKAVIEETSPSTSLSLDAGREAPILSETQSMQSSVEDSPATAPSSIGRASGPSTASFSPRLQADFFRQRSFSVPTHPQSEQSSIKCASTESDVFESLQSVDGDSLFKGVYV